MFLEGKLGTMAFLSSISAGSGLQAEPKGEIVMELLEWSPVNPCLLQYSVLSRTSMLEMKGSIAEHAYTEGKN